MAPTTAQSNILAKNTGIKVIPILSYLPSLFFPYSFPYDFMHLIFKNIMKNLIPLWTGEFKGLDQGTGQYHLMPKVWKAIGTTTAASGSMIPSAFGAQPPNVEVFTLPHLFRKDSSWNSSWNSRLQPEFLESGWYFFGRNCL